MLESRLAALDGTKWMGAVRVNAMPAHCPRAASIGGYKRAGGKAGSHSGRGSLPPDDGGGVCVPSHDVWAQGHASLAVRGHQGPRDHHPDGDVLGRI